MILGPLLFIVYINDLPNASELTDPLLFAYDTSIFYSHSSPNCLEPVLNDELQNIDVWLKCNKLSVNIKKTNYIIFKLRQKKFNSSICLSFGSKPLQQSNTTKFLGSILTIISLGNTISAMYVNKSLNQQVLYLGLTFSYLLRSNSLSTTPSFILTSSIVTPPGRPHMYLTEIEFIICKSELSGL